MSSLVLLHGLGATGRVWDGCAQPRVAPDLPGHGRAGALARYTFETMAAGVAERLPVRRGLVVVGHSLGGVIALELASGRYGVQVDRVIALGVKVSWTDDELAKAAALAQKPVAWFDSRDEAAARYLKVSGLQGLVDPADDSLDDGLMEVDGHWRLAMDPATFGVGAPKMAELIAASQADVVLARGELDPMNTDAELAALHDQVVTLPGLGHSAHVQDPSVGRLLSMNVSP
ncbi:alpha/beta hydrolase [Kribbella antibiotica]|uniref:Alpha/beta hydrolase n=1 Tax=Kribbella antibiotica TaxID=190195 RepID=A0A4R4ZPT4_9ACTN|nr:alpha/beta hydrolase [Kribbella antibiotica]TDD60280.1 alpha/beta hydrolase [Kribbella antibiotica]